MSKAAAELYLKTDAESFHHQTTNEHQEPLIQIWRWITENLVEIDAQEILKRFDRYPMVTITNDENARLNLLGYRSKGDPEQRFSEAEIEIITVTL